MAHIECKAAGRADHITSSKHQVKRGKWDEAVSSQRQFPVLLQQRYAFQGFHNIPQIAPPTGNQVLKYRSL